MTDGMQENAQPEPIENGPMAAEVGNGHACSLEKGCPDRCRTTMWVRGLTAVIVMMGAGAYGAITIKPELVEYIPFGSGVGAQQYPQSSGSCSGCGIAAMSGCSSQSCGEGVSEGVGCSSCGAASSSECLCQDPVVSATDSEDAEDETETQSESESEANVSEPAEVASKLNSSSETSKVLGTVADSAQADSGTEKEASAVETAAD